MTSLARTSGRIFLGSALTFAGISHLAWAREEFRAQVPKSLPLDPDTTVLASGVAEIGLGTALLFSSKKHRPLVGNAAGLFFAAVFPGNIAQYVHKRDGFGLDTDRKRLVRLFFQPALIGLAVWSTRRTA